jgi:lipoprotein-anchoring transpeptidase ErfK/SrfK
MRAAATAVCGAVCLLAAACSGSGPAASGGKQGRGNAPAAASAAQISITPGNGSRHVKPNRGVLVTVTHGKLTKVDVVVGHDPLAGLMSKRDTAWHTLWALRPATRYTVTATAVSSGGKTVTATSSFRTLTPSATDIASTVLADQTYGVGMPIMICFSSAVTKAHRAQVERSIQIFSSKQVVGAWMWGSPQGTCSSGAQALDFRTRNYWPQHTQVRFVAHLDGLEASPGVYFTANLSQSFRIGNSLIGVTSTRTHHTRIYYKGKLYQTWDDSSGMPGDDTENGTYLTIDKGNPVLMSGPGYKNVPVDWSVRFTWSGDYYHSAPWSLYQQGFTNVSHGCVNLSPQHAQWYYEHEYPGDPITITGSPAAGTFFDGWTQWFLSWHQLLRASATHMAVEAGPSGSTLVSASSVPAPTGTGRTSGSTPGNWRAG